LILCVSSNSSDAKSVFEVPSVSRKARRTVPSKADTTEKKSSHSNEIIEMRYVPISLDSPEPAPKPQIEIPIEEDNVSPLIPERVKNWCDGSSSNSSQLEKDRSKPKSTLENLVNALPPRPTEEEEKVNAARM
jgi:hypothetical protein